MKGLKMSKKYNLGYSMLLNAIIMLLYLVIFTPYYEIADDVIFSQFITDGYCNIVFTNYFLCSFIGLVQQLIYPLSAYVIVHMVLAYISYTAITTVLCDKLGYKKATFCTMIITMLFGVNNYLTVSFTRLPGLLCVAGLLSVIHYAGKQRWLAGTVFGALLVIIGSMYRFNVFIMTLVIAMALVLAVSLSEFFGDKEKKFIDLVKTVLEPKRLITAVLTLVICFSVNTVSSRINVSTPELAHYSEYTSLRASIWDYDIPDYEVCKDKYDAIGIDANDIELLRAGYFDENGAMTMEQMQAIKDIQKDFYKGGSKIKDVAVSMIKGELSAIRSLSPEALYIVCFAVIFAVYLFLQKKNQLPMPIIMLAMGVAYYCYLWYKGRVVFRVLFSIWIALICYMIYALDFNEISNRIKRKFNGKARSVIAVAIAMTIAVSGVFLIEAVRHNPHIHYYPYIESAAEINEYINENQDKKFELGRDTNFSCGMPNTVKDIYHQKKTDYTVNYKTVNCTYYLSPFYNYQLEQFGTDNFYENLLNDDVYFVVINYSDHSQQMKKYLQKYYANGKSVEMETIEQLEHYTVYNYSLA